MGMGDQNQIDGGQISHLQSRMTKPFQYEQPAGEIRINDNIQSAHLHEKAGMANKGHAQFMTCNQLWLVGWPVRGVTAEWRTSRPNWLARL